MMKLAFASLLAISSDMVATATAEGIRPSIMKSNNQRLDDMTTEDLELVTRQFVESNIGKIRITNNNNRGVGKGRRRLNGHKGPHDGPHDGADDDDCDDDDVEGSTDVEQGSGHTKHSGKSGKGEESWVAGDPDPDEVSNSQQLRRFICCHYSLCTFELTTVRSFNHTVQLYYLLPVACPGECIASAVGGTYGNELVHSVYECDELDTAQMWLVRSDSSYIQIESYECPGMCIAVDYERGDNAQFVDQTCYNGVLTLKDCNSEFGTEWYFTGGQLVNSFCWGMGRSAMMTIPIVGNGDACSYTVEVFGGDESSIMKADTFMFVNRLPNSPLLHQGTGGTPYTPYIKEAAMKVDENKTKVDEKNGRR